MNLHQPELSLVPDASMRTVTININRRCPLRCAHCSLGFSEEFAGDAFRFDPDELRTVIRAVDPAVYPVVLLAGGEPSLDPELIRVAIDACAEAGLRSALVTAPIWAGSMESVERFLSRVAGLQLLILSYDVYHREFLSLDHYRNAVQGALLAQLMAVIQMACGSDEERDGLLEELGGLRFMVAQVNVVPTVRVGNAAAEGMVDTPMVEIRTEEDLDRLPRRCVLGNAYVDELGGAHGCCWSTQTSASPFTVRRPGGAHGAGAALRELEQRPLFQAVRRDGFLGALRAEGRTALLDLVRGESFSCECDVCIRVMKVEAPSVWNGCGRA